VGRPDRQAKEDPAFLELGAVESRPSLLDLREQTMVSPLPIHPLDSGPLLEPTSASQHPDGRYRLGNMNCDEKTRLATQFEDATAKFWSAVSELRRRIGTSPKGEYESLNRSATEARVKSEQARLALEEHNRKSIAVNLNHPVSLPVPSC
jgi:hypothetical protein